MSQIKHLKGNCSHCSGPIEFPADALGMTADCPHCGQRTELMLPPPADSSGSSVPAKAIVWAVIAAIILGGGLIGALIALKKAERLYGRQKTSATNAVPASAQSSTNSSATAETDPAAKAQFRASHIKIEKKPGSSLVYAVGTITNPTDRQRFGVKVELDLLDSSEQKIGAARDYQQIIEPKGQWTFKALVVEPKTASARLAAVSEDK
jgi:hypothetical protein